MLLRSFKQIIAKKINLKDSFKLLQNDTKVLEYVQLKVYIGFHCIPESLYKGSKEWKYYLNKSKYYPTLQKCLKRNWFLLSNFVTPQSSIN